MAFARPERPYSAASPPTIQGAPSDGKSVGMIDRARAVKALAAPAAARTACSRRSGSARCVASRTSVSVAWMVVSVFPASRSDTGMVAISDLRGSPPCACR
jgi:hypothetical protein